MVTIVTLVVAGSLLIFAEILLPGMIAGERPTIIPMLNAPLGGVVSVHQALRFVILDFPLNAMPEVDQRLFIYRGKQKVGMVKITGPQEGSHIAADLVEGEAKAGDQVRPD